MENRSEIMAELRKNGAFCQDVETRFACGVGDLFVCVAGISYWIELKRWSGKRGDIAPTFRAKQRTWMRDLVRAGGLALVVVERVGRFAIQVPTVGGGLKHALPEDISLESLCMRLTSLHWLGQMREHAGEVTWTLEE